jgi:hypothetical protein
MSELGVFYSFACVWVNGRICRVEPSLVGSIGRLLGVFKGGASCGIDLGMGGPEGMGGQGVVTIDGRGGESWDRRCWLAENFGGRMSAVGSGDRTALGASGWAKTGRRGSGVWPR